MSRKITRRQYLKMFTALSGTALLANPILNNLSFIPEIDNPLDHYPERGWEKIYRDQFRHDSVFHFLCAPNDTHNCLLRAYVKNGVMVRIGPSYGYGLAEDIYGNRSSARMYKHHFYKGTWEELDISTRSIQCRHIAAA